MCGCVFRWIEINVEGAVCIDVHECVCVYVCVRYFKGGSSTKGRFREYVDVCVCVYVGVQMCI